MSDAEQFVRLKYPYATLRTRVAGPGRPPLYEITPTSRAASWEVISASWETPEEAWECAKEEILLCMVEAFER